MEKVEIALLIVVFAVAFIVTPAHAQLQPVKNEKINIAKGLVVRGDLMLVINNTIVVKSNNQSSLASPPLAQCQGCITANMIAPHSINQTHLAFGIHNGTNGEPGKNATVTICQMTGTNICPIPKHGFFFNATQ